ncbi:hypothetical protein [Desulfobacula sp.]
MTLKVIKAGLPTLKAIVKIGTGIDSIDIDAAKEYGVMDILEGRDSIIRSLDPRLQNQSDCIYSIS